MRIFLFSERMLFDSFNQQGLYPAFGIALSVCLMNPGKNSVRRGSWHLMPACFPYLCCCRSVNAIVLTGKLLVLNLMIQTSWYLF